MPNWCHNTLRVTGPPEELVKFVEKAKPTQQLMARAHCESLEQWWPLGEPKPTLEQWFSKNYANQPLTFEAFAPQPEEVGDWYSWRCENWGTKWDASFNGVGSAFGAESADLDASLAFYGLTNDLKGATYQFDTAWSPPFEAVLTMATQHPLLEFQLRYAEVGMYFAGEYVFRDGCCVKSVSLKVDDVLAPEQLWY